MTLQKIPPAPPPYLVKNERSHKAVVTRCVLDQLFTVYSGTFSLVSMENDTNTASIGIEVKQKNLG